METLQRKLIKLINPSNMGEAMCLTSIYLRLSGMFPYYWEKDRYKFSFRSILLTCLHIGLYIFVNAKLILHDIEEYSQPVIYDNNIGIAGQFLLRILGVVITLIELYHYWYNFMQQFLEFHHKCLTGFRIHRLECKAAL